MVTEFPQPVLAVAPDAVRDLDGREALSALWTLFTKCKGSLQDGRRLENISWRLWYRELMLADRAAAACEQRHKRTARTVPPSSLASSLASSASSASSSSASAAYPYSHALSPSNGDAMMHTTDISISSVYTNSATSKAYPPTPSQLHARMRASLAPNPQKGVIIDTPQSTSHTTSPASSSLSSSLTATATGTAPSQRGMRSKQQNHTLNQHGAWMFSSSDNTPALDIPTGYSMDNITGTSSSTSMNNITGTTISKRSSAGINENMMSTDTDTNTNTSTTTTQYTLTHTPSATLSPSLHRQMYNSYTQTSPTTTYYNHNHTTASHHHTHAPVQYRHSHQRTIPPPLSVQILAPADDDAMHSALPSPRLTPLIPAHPAPSIPYELAPSIPYDLAPSIPYDLALCPRDHDRPRRTSFVGMRVGEIICDMLPPSLPPQQVGAGVGVGLEKAYVTRATKEKEFVEEEGARFRVGEGAEEEEELGRRGRGRGEGAALPSESATLTSTSNSARTVLADASGAASLDSPGPGAEAEADFGFTPVDVIASSTRSTHTQTGAGGEGMHEGVSAAVSGGALPAQVPLPLRSLAQAYARSLDTQARAEVRARALDTPIYARAFDAPTYAHAFDTPTHARSLAHVDSRTGTEGGDRTGTSDKAASETHGYPVFEEAQGNGRSSEDQGHGQRGVAGATPRGEVLPMVHYHHLSQPSGASTPPMVNYTGVPEAEFSEPPPMLVVVNPTPNLTPHPTPPSTPVMYGAAGRGQWLMPPRLNLNRGTHRSVDLAKEDTHNLLLRDQVNMEQFSAVVSRLPPSIFPPRMHLGSRADEARPQPQAPLRAFQQVLGEAMTMSQSLSQGVSQYRLQQQHDGLPHADVTDVGRDGVVAGMGPGFVPGFSAPGDLHDMVPLVNPYAPGNDHDMPTAAMKQSPPMTLGGVGAPNRLSMSSTASTSSHMTSLSGYSAASTSATSASGAEGAETDIGMLRAEIGVGAEADGCEYAETACSDGTATLVTVAVPANHVVPDKDENVAHPIVSDWREVVRAGEAEALDGGAHAHGLDQGGHAHPRRGTKAEALEEEEDEPLSPLPSATAFTSASRSRSPRSASNHCALLQLSPPQVEEEDSTAAAAQRRRKRHSAPPRSTSDSVQMRLVLSLSPTSTLDPQLPVSPTAGEAGPPEVTGMTVLPRQQSASASSRSRSAGSKRSSFSAANKRKGSTGPPPSVPAAGPSTGPHPDASNNAPNGALTRQSSTGRGASSSLEKSRSRSRDAGINVALGMTLAAVANAAVAGAGPARGAKTAMKNKGKFSARGGNKKILALRRNSSSAAVSARAKMKQKEIEMEDDEEDFDDEEEGEIKELDSSHRGEVDMAREAERAQQAREKEQRMRELEEQVREMEKDQERAFAHAQARRAAQAEEEKQRRRDLELQQRQLATMAALDAPPLADNVSETSSKRPIRFNIGSNSDDGVGSKSTGSGSDASGALSGQSFVEAGAATAKGKEKEVYVNQPHAFQQQQLLLPPPMAQVYGHPQMHHDQNHVIPPALQQPTNGYMQVNQQMSKLQLRQLEGMEQMRQYRAGTGPVPQIPFQPPTQAPVLAPFALVSQQDMTSTVIAQTISNDGTSKQCGAVILPAVPKGTTLKDNSGNAVAAAAAGADKAMVAKVEETLDLNQPLLPTGKKRVQVMTESEFETTDDDGGEWSSEEMTADEEQQRLARLQREEVDKKALAQIQDQHHRQLQQLQPAGRRQHVQPRPAGMQRMHSSHYPVANNARGKQSMRVAAAKAAKEAEEQRLRELFVKLPASSYQDLAKARTNSVGNLTRLLNPDPEIFPVNHPYRRGYSSGEIRRPGISALSSMQPMTHADASRPAAAAPPPPPAAAIAAPVAAVDPPARVSSGSHPSSLHRRKSSDVTSGRPVFSPPLRSAGLATSKSAVALPLATQIQVGSSNGPAAARVDHTYGMANHVYVNSASTGSGGYRPKGPPKDQVMESDSEEEGEGIIMPSSIAQEKLKALAERRGIPPTRRASEGNAPATQPQPPVPAVDEDVVPQWAKVSPQPPPTRTQSHGSSSRRVPEGLRITRAEPPIQRPLPTAPIPVEYPYNLPLPIAPTTPKTTRRNMLANEMSESLRRNLLWQRHSSKPNLAALKRTASAGGSRNNGFAPLPPVAGFPPMVQLHAKGTKPEGTSLLTANPLANKEEREAARQRREALSRNKSWANADFHATGW